jgi:uncharacterized Zn-finger protein
MEGSESSRWGWILLVSLGAFMLLWGVRILHANRVTCPLCLGTPFRSKPCQKHDKAVRWPLFGYALTAVLMMMVRGAFHCMYCGTAYRTRR